MSSGGAMMGERAAGLILCFAMALGGAGAPTSGFAADMVIGAGNEAKVHYTVGRSICRQIQKGDQGLSCEVLRIEGQDAAEPLAVLGYVRDGAIEVGLVQSDWQYHAFLGTGPAEFMDVKFDNLRSLFSLHGEPFTIIARRDAAINTLDDLVGKRVNLGNPGSSQRVIMEMVMRARGWTQESFQFVDELTSAEQSLALCHNRVQAIVTTVSHPNDAVAKTLELCDAKVVEISGSEIEKLIADNRFFAATEVPAGIYDRAATAVRTFGVKVTAVSSADIDDDTAYAVVKTVFDNLDKIKRIHRALGNLVPDRMMTDGLSAPLHPGAMRYFREQGMM
jgi:TRAP transporter TAXI family solute receptor